MSHVNDLTGQRFGKLVVCERAKNKKQDGRAWWTCLCDCGNKKEIKGHDLISGRIKSCGCLRREATSEFNRKTKKKVNRYDLTNGYGIGFSSNDGTQFYFDLEDYEKIRNFCWYADTNGYISSRKDGERVQMHWIIMGRKYIDHINGRVYDNRKENLRPYDNWENNINRKKHKNNTSGYTGVRLTKYKENYKWQAYIQYKNTFMSLGVYKDIKEAVAARREAEQKYFGEWNR